MPWSWACFLWLTILLGLWQCFCSLLVDSFLTVLSVLWWISSLISLVHFGCPLVYRWCLVFGGSLFSTDLLVVSLHHFLGLLGSPPPFWVVHWFVWGCMCSLAFASGNVLGLCAWRFVLGCDAHCSLPLMLMCSGSGLQGVARVPLVAGSCFSLGVLGLLYI